MGNLVHDGLFLLMGIFLDFFVNGVEPLLFANAEADDGADDDNDLKVASELGNDVENSVELDVLMGDKWISLNFNGFNYIDTSRWGIKFLIYNIIC